RLTEAAKLCVVGQGLVVHPRVAVLQDPVDLAGLGEVALARVVGPVVLLVPGAAANTGVEVDAVHRQDVAAVLGLQVEEGRPDGAAVHGDSTATLGVADVLVGGVIGGRGGSQAECQERGGACG